MSGPDDPFSFDAEFGDPDYVKSVRIAVGPQTGRSGSTAAHQTFRSPREASQPVRRSR